jgi:hypothetical protein
MIACVAQKGHHLKPYVAVPLKTLEVELYELGFPLESCRIVHQENGFVTPQLFED